MTDYIRRIVSGNKARFKDHNLNVELDLVYVTDQVIIMGYPASGVEGLYRNRKEDAVRFLKHRHGENYWVFNFCPLKENSYDADVFGGRVSRYPFPDHHAPPLAIMPLFAREMHEWLKGSPDRVAVLHCKAGKGRSGTMACTYLLSLDDNPTNPQLERSHSAKEWAKKRTQSTIDTLPEESAPTSSDPAKLLSLLEKPPPSDTEGILDVDTGASPPRSPTPNREKSFTDALKGVLDLHTARRMKAPSDKESHNVKQGVSIPSQRRFLYYWALLLSHEAPKHMWAPSSPRPKVRLMQLKLYMRETSGIKMNLVRAANKFMEKTSMAKAPEGESSSPIWASLSRYDDRLVELLEGWELHTRDSECHMGKRRPASENWTRGDSAPEEVLSEIFSSGRWDHGKMVRSFARLGVTNGDKRNIGDDKGEKINEYTLRPLSDKRWEGLKHDIQKGATDNSNAHRETLEVIDQQADAVGFSRSEANSMHDVSSPVAIKKCTAGELLGVNLEEAVLLDAGREVRVKLYIGQVFICWFWFIPTFHMPQPPPSDVASTNTTLTTSFSLIRKELDFPIGLGSAIVDVEIAMEWVTPSSSSSTNAPLPIPIITDGDTVSASSDNLTDLEPPVRARTEDSEIGVESEPGQAGITLAVQAIVGGGKEAAMEGMKEVGIRETVEAKQGVE